ncbi:DUF551 domain-containing protein [Klebsiella pneumoniae]|uniref:DUF551 domain-containing protein n=2 Tax=Klebsiella pneumoniae TaxID=573 RepID=UPI002695DCC7
MTTDITELAQESCEPVAWMHNNNDIGIPAITVSQKVGHYWMAEFENVQPLYRHAQSAPEYPETLPCPVFLEPGMRFGKGVKTRLVLDAIQRRAEHYAELEAMTPEERAEHDANIEAFKAMLPQPTPVVPAEPDKELTDDVLDEIIAGAKTSMEQYLALSLKAEREAWRQRQPTDDERIMEIEGIHNCERCGDEGWIVGEMGITRRACGQDGNSPVIPDGYVMAPKVPTDEMISSGIAAHYERSQIQIHDRPAPGPMECAYVAMLAAAPHDTPALNSVQSVATVPGKWIPVSERMPEDRISVILWDAEIGEVTSGHYSHKTQTFYHCGDAIENEITHWMPPPCAPQEPSLACISKRSQHLS